MKRVQLSIFITLLTLHVSAQDIIQMEMTGGVYKVPCKINGLGLKFIFDTGASDVSLSLSEAVFMVKNGYLNESDFRGTETYRIANGDIAEGTKVNLRKVEFGKQTLYNVEASIVHSMDAPLLLGQSVLQRLGKFSVDYSNNTLIVGGGSVVSNKSNSNSNTTSTTSSTTGTVTDINGKVYKTVKIGNQWWMAENLDVDRFRNGDPIPQAVTADDWYNAGRNKQPAWCYYDNNPKNGANFGKLYNSFAVNDPRGLAPIGFHVPTYAECNILVSFVGSTSGKLLKAVSGWNNNGNGTNKIGFTALSIGGRGWLNGRFEGKGNQATYWTSTKHDEYATSYYFFINQQGIMGVTVYNFMNQNFGYSRECGLSVRCIKD